MDITIETEIDETEITREVIRDDRFSEKVADIADLRIENWADSYDTIWDYVREDVESAIYNGLDDGERIVTAIAGEMQGYANVLASEHKNGYADLCSDGQAVYDMIQRTVQDLVKRNILVGCSCLDDTTYSDHERAEIVDNTPANSNDLTLSARDVAALQEIEKQVLSIKVALSGIRDIIGSEVQI